MSPRPRNTGHGPAPADAPIVPPQARNLIGGLLSRAGAGRLAGTDEADEAGGAAVRPDETPADDTDGRGPGLPGTARGRARAKLWQLDRKFHCPIVGTCFDSNELRRLARRLGLRAGVAAGLAHDYERHVEAVAHCGSRNRISETIQRLLDARYAAALRRFSPARDEAAVIERWQECLARGDLAGPFWATVTHKHAGDEARAIAYGAIHMLSHQVGAGLAADVRRLDFLDQDNTRLRLELAAQSADAARRADITDDGLRALRDQVATLRAKNAELESVRARLAELESGVGMITLARRLMALSDENAALRSASARSDALTERADRLATDLAAERIESARLRAEHTALERLLLAVPPAADASMPAACPEAEACLRCSERQPLARERCILCVGGRTSLLSHYRALAARLGLELIHHDGGQEEALSRLPELIARADAVLCPTDCVGHAAYYSLKQHCRKSRKPCLLFKGAGVTSFAFALSRLSAGESSLPTDAAETE